MFPIRRDPRDTTYPEHPRQIEYDRAAGNADTGLIPVAALQTSLERANYGFTYFNSIQSDVFSTAYRTDASFIVAAPTGSGKTVCLELAMLRFFSPLITGRSNDLRKCVYLCPTKALCSEKAESWKNRYAE